MSATTHPGAVEGPHHVPQPGASPGVRVGEGRHTNQANFINIQGRLFAPLQGLNPADVLQGGFGWLSPTDGGATFHPGLDLNSGGSCNADLGLPVVAMLGGVIEAVLPWDGWTSGEGNHLWYRIDDPVSPGPTWVHTNHLNSFAVIGGRTITPGQVVVPGQVIGYCGRTGNWDCAHAHTELLPLSPPGGWWQWPRGWSRAQVEAGYYNPWSWWQAAVAKVGNAPPEIVSMILSGAQTAAVQAVMWSGYDFNPDTAISTAWRDDWHNGIWRGRAISAEQSLPEDTQEGKPAGVFQLFEYGCAVWLPGLPASWNG